MITKNNFKDLLKTLDFTEEGNTLQKSDGEVDLKVDFSKQRLIYPEDKGLIVSRRDTCNFSHPENFVVFECVHRLLEKGYKPEHLELEPRWRVGRGASGGRADILVRDHENNPLLIIECKTAGDEFHKAWNKTLQDGDQLFSYAQQIRKTQYLCLYASDFVENKVRIDQRIIAHRDDENVLAQDETSQSFAEAADVEDRYTVWREIYQLGHAENGIFEKNVQAYQIGKNKHTLAEDTKIIDAVDKERKYHDFRTILRKHNIARREHAFEVLVNLFLCKLVDEEENQNDLQFYWKGVTYDNYFDFVDRLQNLYQKGMRKFLNEEISYISNEQIDNAFWTVKNRRNATKQQIQRYFRELKFFSNSAFSFLDTHNEALFKRNAKVLSEVVQMWQGLRLKAEVPNQFLGDMFEMFLDDGVKQSEGQFFTPLPICKFIVASLPLAQKISENTEPPNAIDYACGSGHFLNEYAHQIKPLVKASYRNLTDYYSQITGIEKEDRLAKVAKVAAYMHGQQQIQILDADALTSHPEIQREAYDILIANPPFAVEGFLQTLNDTDKKEYQLIQTTGEKSNTDNVECFFLERLRHLMAPGGVVGVIVPSSILSNTEAVHNRTREILLQFFDIVSIAELGSGTFGKTGTNTVVLFLKRKTQRPETAEHYRNRVTDFFEGDTENQAYQDEYLIKAYCKHIEIPYQEYIKLFAQTSLDPLSDLLEYDIFKDYKQAFSQSTKIKNLKKSKTYKEKTPEEQSEELTQRLIAYLHKIEKEKLYYFILAHQQENRVLIVNAPNTKREQKQFLGYAWSERKGDEGIKYEGNAKTVNDIVTPLFNPKDLSIDDTTKINTAIKNNFIGEITDPLPEHCHHAKLTDLLNFSRVDFDKIINLNPQQNTNIETQWPLVRLGEVVETQYGYTAKAGDEGDVRYLRITDITGEGQLKNTNKKYINPSEQIIQDYTLNPNDIVIARSGSTGRMLLYKGI
ncbi:N-6 DNA methylase, partial [Candidatus Poribacteria bacterium]|nr:N-6 DNA methylase [Candidatus Poribacteria bacterium]